MFRTFFWNASWEELKQGYIQESDSYKCLLCGGRFEKEIIYPHEGIHYEAERYARMHIKMTHKSVFEYLMELDKKLTGLTEHQNQLLRLFYHDEKEFNQILKAIYVDYAMIRRYLVEFDFVDRKPVLAKKVIRMENKK